MVYIVCKIGEYIFDFLHALGLCIILSYATGAEVELDDSGPFYRIRSETPPEINVTELLDKALELPEKIGFLTNNQSNNSTITIANFDGLLAALFTIPGVRAASVSDLLLKQNIDPSAFSAALLKLGRAKQRWKTYLGRAAKHFSPTDSLSNLLHYYSSQNFKVPVPVEKTSAQQLSLVMPVAPSFSLSTRRPISDGAVTDKSQLSLIDDPYAVLLSFIGAARFLRAQRVAGKQVVFYVPIMRRIVVRPDSRIPVLSAVNYTPDLAIVLRALELVIKKGEITNNSWEKLSYQVLQTQGGQQSISRDRGIFDLNWLNRISTRIDVAIISYWHQLLKGDYEALDLEIDNLLNLIKNQQTSSWIAHLYELARVQAFKLEAHTRYYSIGEIKEISRMMIDAKNSPLVEILEREKGTIRFGYALRLLGKYNLSALRDLVENLDSVRTQDQLLSFVALIAQECVVAGARSQFIIVPDDEDLVGLITDMEKHGPRTLALILMILAYLRYPRSFDNKIQAVEVEQFNTAEANNGEVSVS